MRKASLLTLLFTLLLAGAFVYAGAVQAQGKDKDKKSEEADDAEEEDEEEEEEEADYEEEDVEEEDEEEVDEDEEEEDEDEEDEEEYDEEEETDEDEDEDEEEDEPEKEREPLPEFPEPGVTITEGKWVNLTFNGALVSQFLLAMENLKGENDGKFRYDHSFTLPRILLGFDGDFWDRRITFGFLGDLGGLMRHSGSAGQDSGFLLDAYAGIRPLIGMVPEAFEGLHIKFGRFAPGFGYYHVRNEAMLDVAIHPLVVSAMMPGRQIGLEIEFAHEYFEIAVGVFNGMRYYASADPITGELASSIWIRPGFDTATLGNIIDDNKGKDIMVRLTGRIPFGLSISGYLYMARPEFHVVGANHVVAPTFVYGGEAVYENLLAGHMRLKLVANFTGRTMTYPELAGGGEFHPTITQYGFLFHAGLKIGQWVEPVVRAEMWNGRASDYLSPAIPFEGQSPFATPVPMADGDTWEMWATGGLNVFLFSDHCRLTLLGTYIHRANEGLSSDFWLTAQAALVI